MTRDEIKAAVNDLKDEMQRVELRLFQAGYRSLSSEIYDARLRLSGALSRVCGWPSYDSPAPADDACPRCKVEPTEPGYAICRSCAEADALAAPVREKGEA